MIVKGEIVEVGRLDGEGGDSGFVIKRPDGSFVTVKGLSDDETRAAAALMFQPIAATLSVSPNGVPP